MRIHKRSDETLRLRRDGEKETETIVPHEITSNSALLQKHSCGC